MRISFSLLCQAILIKNAELTLTQEYELRDTKLRRRYDDAHHKLKGEYQAKLEDVGCAKHILWDEIRTELGDNISSDGYGIDLETGNVVADEDMPKIDMRNEDRKLNG